MSASSTLTKTAETSETSEREAVQVAMHGSTLLRWRVGLRAITTLLRNPDDTTQTFILAAVLDRNHIAEPFFRFMIDARGFALMREQPALDSTTLDFDALALLPAGTLGHAYARHMLEQKLDPDVFREPPGAPEAIAYLAKRLRQTHDIWHVLTGYATDVAGEVALQGFVFGQFGTPAPGLTAVVGTLLCLRRDLGAVRRTWNAYRRGKRASFLLVVRWEDHWSEPLDALRARLGISTATAPRALRS